jgi:hypothetical protein
MGLATIFGFAGDLAAVVAADFAFVSTVDFVFGRDLLPSADFEVGFAFPKPLSFDKVLDLEADAGLSSKVAFEAALGFAAAFALLACVAGVDLADRAGLAKSAFLAVAGVDAAFDLGVYWVVAAADLTAVVPLALGVALVLPVYSDFETDFDLMVARGFVATSVLTTALALVTALGDKVGFTLRTTPDFPTAFFSAFGLSFLILLTATFLTSGGIIFSEPSSACSTTMASAQRRSML